MEEIRLDSIVDELIVFNVYISELPEIPANSHRKYKHVDTIYYSLLHMNGKYRPIKCIKIIKL